MKSKLLLAVALIIILIVAVGNQFEFQGDPIKHYHFPSLATALILPTTTAATTTLITTPLPDQSFEEIKSARVPSADELKTPTFSELRMDREPREGNGRTLMIIAFERTERSTKNVEFLMNQVVGGPRATNIDFIFVDTSKQGPFNCFPQLPNVLYIHRARVGFDICSYKVGLALVPPGHYKYIVLMNGSVRGPFTTEDDFLAMFKHQLNDRTPVVGTSVNCGPRLHIQSMFFMLNSVGAELMNATLSCDVPNYASALRGPHGELNLSMNFVQAGFNLGALQLLWRGVDIFNQSMLRKTCHLVGNDPYAPMRDRDPKTLEKKDIDPNDVLFYKTTRKVGQERLRNLTKIFDDECTGLSRTRRNCGLRNFSLTSC